jgi:exopolyphosphatase/guanosine-5'-triphosphate,3'-diphosphate pyrophosphatase
LLLVDAVRRATGITVEVISGQEEGRFAYVAVEAGLAIGKGSVVVFDTGGGSSQFTFGRDSQVREQFSVDVGAVRYTERFGLNGPVTEDALGRALAAISAHLSRIEGRPRPDSLVAMGWAATNMAAVNGMASWRTA